MLQEKTRRTKHTHLITRDRIARVSHYIISRRINDQRRHRRRQRRPCSR